MKKCTLTLLVYSSFSFGNPLYVSNGDVLNGQSQFYGDLGLSYYTDTFVGQKNNDAAVANIGYNGTDFNADLFGIKYRFIGNDTSKLNMNIFAGNTFFGYDEDDATILKGRGDRKYSIDAGLGLDYRLSRSHTISLSVQHDVSDAYKGLLANAKLFHVINARSFSLVPYLDFQYQSKDLVNYYYGVEKNDVSSNRTIYSPSHDMSIGFGYYFSFPIDENWHIRQDSIFTKFGSEISDSPLIENDYRFNANIYVSYLF